MSLLANHAIRRLEIYRQHVGDACARSEADFLKVFSTEYAKSVNIGHHQT